MYDLHLIFYKDVVTYKFPHAPGNKKAHTIYFAWAFFAIRMINYF